MDVKSVKGTIAISSKNHISKFLDPFNLCMKFVEKFTFLLKKGRIYYEYTDSWTKVKEKSLPPKEKLFSTLNREEYLTKAINMHKESEIRLT